MNQPNNRWRRASLAALLLAGTALGGLGLHARADALPQAPQAAITAPATPAGPASFADLVARVRPAVVTVTTTERMQAAQRNIPDPMLRRFFGMPDQPQPRATHALGSGFLIDAEGYIVTNNHVVEGASAIRVALDDGREFDARVIGRDPRTDLALIKVDASAPLPFITLGDSSHARPGDWVVALGNPYGLGGTVTAGIVSALGRDIGSGPYDDFLQVDAPINRGNSGGPLFAQDGTVIGVNTAIFSPSGGSIGIGFAIPSNLVRQVVAQLKESGHVERGFLGVSTQPLNPALAEAMHISATSGALVAEVEKGSPAARAGLRAGDVVTAVDGTRIGSPRELARTIGTARPGSSTRLTVLREGNSQELQVTLAQLPDKSADRRGDEQAGPEAGVGLALAPLTGAAREALNLPAGVSGAVVASVRPDSSAAEAGLRPGDVITAVGGHEVTDVAEVARAIRQAERQQGAVALRILRDGHSAFVALPAPSHQG